MDQKAIKNFLPMQQGDVKATFANTELLEEKIKYKPRTSVKDGIFNFVSWYRDFYKV